MNKRGAELVGRHAENRGVVELLPVFDRVVDRTVVRDQKEAAAGGSHEQQFVVVAAAAGDLGIGQSGIDLRIERCEVAVAVDRQQSDMLDGRNQLALPAGQQIDDVALHVADRFAAQILAQPAEGGAILYVDAAVGLVEEAERVVRFEFADGPRGYFIDTDLLAALEEEASRAAFECNAPEIVAVGADVAVAVEERVGRATAFVALPVAEFVDSGRVEPPGGRIVTQGPDDRTPLRAAALPADSVVDAETVVRGEEDPAAVAPFGGDVPDLGIGDEFGSVGEAFHVSLAEADLGCGAGPVRNSREQQCQQQCRDEESVHGEGVFQNKDIKNL